MVLNNSPCRNSRPINRIWIGLLLNSVIVLSAWGEQPQDFLSLFAVQAKKDDAVFAGFDAGLGEQFFKSRHGAEWSCSTCHTENPTATGKHTVTQKVLEPLAPSANSARFTNVAKVEKWFKRNCTDVLKRECTALEKGNLLTYLLSLDR